MSTPEDEAIVERMIALHGNVDRELAVARAGCAILDHSEKSDARSPTPELPGAKSELRSTNAEEADALKRWCAARIHDRAYRGWVIFRFPETLDYFNLVDVQRPDPKLPEALLGPDWRLRRRDGFKLTDPRFSGREVLSEIHYCVLCHERDKDSCSKGIHDKSGAVAANPLGIELAGCPLDEKISEMHALRKERRRDRRPRARHARQPDVSRHRPSHLQRLHEVLHLPEAGSGQHPADRDRRADRRPADAVGRGNLRTAHALESAERAPPVSRCRTTARTCSSSVSAPPAIRSRTISSTKGFGVVGIDGLKIEPLPAEPTSWFRPIQRLVRHLQRSSTRACSKASAACPSTASRCAGTRISSRCCT